MTVDLVDVESKAAGFVDTLAPTFQAAAPTIGPRDWGDGLRIFVCIAKSRFYLDFHHPIIRAWINTPCKIHDKTTKANCLESSSKQNQAIASY